MSKLFFLLRRVEVAVDAYDLAGVDAGIVGGDLVGRDGGVIFAVAGFPSSSAVSEVMRVFQEDPVLASVLDDLDELTGNDERFCGIADRLDIDSFSSIQVSERSRGFAVWIFGHVFLR